MDPSVTADATRFIVARASVADRKHTGKTCLQHVRGSLWQPWNGMGRLLEIAPCEYEALLSPARCIQKASQSSATLRP